MEHHRRKKLIRALNEMYLDNFKASQDWSYKKVERQLNYYSTLRSKLELDAEIRDVGNRSYRDLSQMSLF